MKYVPPVGGLANDPYVDANPVGGIEGSPVPAAAIENPMREIEALIVDAGLVPSNANLAQLVAATRTLIQKQSPVISAAGGTANALTAAYTPAIAALTNGMTLFVRPTAANSTTTPTFTPASGVVAAKAIVKGNGQALLVGDIAGAGHWLHVQYDSALDKWVLLNPALGVTQQVSAASTLASGKVRLATEAETTAGTAADIAVTPAGLDAALVGALPAGEVAFFAKNTAPAGYLKANGAAISRTTYATLFAAIDTTFGVGNGSTTFNVPDMRGYFPRGWDDARGVDSGRAFGTSQQDAVIAHTHAIANALSSAGGSGWPDGSGSAGFTISATGAVTSGASTETRPKNIALLACIKY